MSDSVSRIRIPSFLRGYLGKEDSHRRILVSLRGCRRCWVYQTHHARSLSHLFQHLSVSFVVDGRQLRCGQNQVLVGSVEFHFALPEVCLSHFLDCGRLEVCEAKKNFREATPNVCHFEVVEGFVQRFGSVVGDSSFRVGNAMFLEFPPSRILADDRVLIPVKVHLEGRVFPKVFSSVGLGEELSF